MALRVLLADESTSIKKVMQLALQDYGVEVKSVPIGLDVIEVAKSFRPDIAFIDVLLQKRSGYDVLADIRKDPELHNLPIILMWSGFMDLDEKRLSEAQPDARLEKPFEADTLREMTKRLVPRFQDSPVEQYLRFPHLPSFEEEEPRRRPDAEIPPPSALNDMHTAPKAKLPSAPPSSFSDDPFAGLSGFTAEDDDGDMDQPHDRFTSPAGLAGDYVPPKKQSDDYDPTVALRTDYDNTYDKNPGGTMPEGIDLGDLGDDAEDGFAHVPLSALKQDGQPTPPEGVSPRNLPSSRPQAQGGERRSMQGMINEARNTGELPQRPPQQRQEPHRPQQTRDDQPRDHQTSNHPTAGFPQPPKAEYFDDEESDTVHHQRRPAQHAQEPEHDRYGSRQQNSYNEIDVDDEDMQWQSNDLSKYKLDLPEVDEEHTPSPYQIDDELDEEPELLRQAGEPAPAAPSASKAEIQQMIQAEVAKATSQAVHERFQNFFEDEIEGERLEDIIRTVAAGAVEAAVWKLVPDIAERLVREELSRLLKDIDDSVGVKRDPS